MSDEKVVPFGQRRRKNHQRSGADVDHPSLPSEVDALTTALQSIGSFLGAENSADNLPFLTKGLALRLRVDKVVGSIVSRDTEADYRALVNGYGVDELQRYLEPTDLELVRRPGFYRAVAKVAMERGFEEGSSES